MLFGSRFRAGRWIFGIEVPAREGGTGFDMETLAPTRNQTRAERLITLACTLTTAFAPWFVLGYLMEKPSPSWILALPGAGWVLRMCLPPRLPMDRVALSVGVYTFAPWAAALLARPRYHSWEEITGDGQWLVWQVVGFVTVVAIGLAMDIRAEIARSKAR
jgi:hypothetical protein